MSENFPKVDFSSVKKIEFPKKRLRKKGNSNPLIEKKSMINWKIDEELKKNIDEIINFGFKE